MKLPEEKNDTPTNLLSNDELAFVAAYFECNMNGTRAYMKLHPKASYQSAKALSSATLTNVNLKAEITRILTERAMSAEEAVARMGAIAKADIYPFIRTGEDGFVYFDLSDPQAQEHLYLIKEMETKRERRIEGKGKDAEVWEGEWVKVKLHDAYIALRDIAKMHGKLTEKVDMTSNGETLKLKEDNAGFDRAISTLADVLREIVSDKDTKQNGEMETPK